QVLASRPTTSTVTRAVPPTTRARSVSRSCVPRPGSVRAAYPDIAAPGAGVMSRTAAAASTVTAPWDVGLQSATRGDADQAAHQAEILQHLDALAGTGLGVVVLPELVPRQRGGQQGGHQADGGGARKHVRDQGSSTGHHRKPIGLDHRLRLW